jgi:hypothetical protein
VQGDFPAMPNLKMMTVMIAAAALCNPTQDASLVFASCVDPNVFWPGIVEKA